MEDKTHNPSAKITGYLLDGILVLPPAFHGIKKKTILPEQPLLLTSFTSPPQSFSSAFNSSMTSLIRSYETEQYYNEPELAIEGRGWLY